MATASGVSIKARQNLVVSTSAPNNLVSVAITNFPARPFSRVGYFTLFQFNNTSPFQTYLVHDGNISRPGLLIKPQVPLITPGFTWGLDVQWYFPGLNWTATIA